MLKDKLADIDVLVVKGTGNVGSALLDSLQQIGLGDKIMGVVARNGGIVCLDQSTRANYIESFVAGGDQRTQLIEGYDGVESLDELCDKLVNMGLNPIIMDASNDPAIGTYPTLIQNGFRVSTANKYESSEAEAEDAIRLMNNPRFGYDPTVMAGQGALLKLQGEAADFRDDILGVEGSFSGTCSYLTNELEKEVPYSVALCKAMELGYTEPNPMDDADGKDVAKKLVIIARTLGYEVGLEDVEVEGLLGDDYRSVYEEVKSHVESRYNMTSLTAEESEEIKKDIREEFTKRVKDGGVDDYYAGEVSKNKLMGLVPRYIASMKIENGTPKLKVSLQFVSPTSELGAASSNKMIISINRHINPLDSDKDEIDYPGVLGAGAGPYVTAKGIIRQVDRIVDRTGIVFN